MTDQMQMRELGDRQRWFLRYLDTNSYMTATTVKMARPLQGLVRRGLAFRDGDTYTITPKGQKVLRLQDQPPDTLPPPPKASPKAYVFIGRPWDTSVTLWTLDGLPIEGIEDQVAEAVEDYMESEDETTVQAWIGFEVEIETKTVLKPDAIFDKIKELFT